MSGRPPEQNCFRRHLHQALQLLPSLQQVGQAWALLQADLVEEADPEEGPWSVLVNHLLDQFGDLVMRRVT